MAKGKRQKAKGKQKDFIGLRHKPFAFSPMPYVYLSTVPEMTIRWASEVPS